MKLYEIKAEYINLLDAIDAGEIPEEAIADTLEAVEGELKDKADNIACLIKQEVAEAAMLKAEEAALAERRRVKEKVVERMKAYLTDNLLAAGMDKIETARVKITFRASESVGVEDMEALMKYAMLHPEVIKVRDPEANKTEIKRMLKSGEKVDGCALVTNQNIQIK